MNKAYFGLGVSENYLRMISGLTQKLEDVPYKDMIFLIADDLRKECNGVLNDELANNIEKELKKLGKPVFRWKFIEDQKQYKEYVEKYSDMYDTNSSFFKDLTSLMMKNREDLTFNNLRKRAGYSIGELACINMLSKEYVKIGPKTEIQFDNLAILYPLDKKINSNNFYYV